MYGPIAGAAGTDGTASNNYLQTLKVNKVISSSKESETISNALSSYFGSDFDVFKAIDKVDGLSSTQKKEMVGNPYQSNAWGGISGIYSTIYSLIGNGISNSLLSTLLSALRIAGLSSMDSNTVDSINSIIGGLGNVKDDIITNLNKIQNNSNSYYMYWFYQELSILLANLYPNTKPITIEDIAKNKNPWSYIIDKLKDQFKQAFSKKNTVSFDPSKDISPLLEMFIALSYYINAFDSYTNSSLNLNNDWSEENHNHLFSKDESNYIVIKKVAEQTTTNATIEKCNLSVISTLLNGIFGGKGNVDKVQFNRVMQILFHNLDTTDGARLTSTPILGDGTANPVYQKEGGDGLFLNLNADGKGGIDVSKSSIVGNMGEHMYGLGPLLASVIDGYINTTSVGPLMFILPGILQAPDESHLFAILTNVIMPLLANDNCKKLVSSLGTDLCGILNSSLISILKDALKMFGITLPIPSTSTIEPYIGLIKSFGSYFNRPLEDIIYGSTVLPLIFLLLEMVNIPVPDNFKSCKNINDLLSKNISIMGVDMPISSLTTIIIEITNMVSNNTNDILDLLKSMNYNMPKKLEVYDANGKELTDPKKLSDSSVTFNGKTYTNSLILGLSVIDDSKKGYQYVYTDESGNKVRLSGLEFGEKLLGYESKNNTISVIPGSFLYNLQKMANKKGDNSLNDLMSKLKIFFSASTTTFYTDRNKVFMEYMNSKNFSTSNVEYKNFSDNNYESTLSYVLHYKYKGKTLNYKLSLLLPGGKNMNYQFKNIEKL